MSKIDRALMGRFSDLLKNERGFHLLFCDMIETEYLALYQNKSFAEDPIFNHFVLKEELLGSQSNLEPNKVRAAIQSAKSKSVELKLSTSIFIENFWPRTNQFEKSAIESGYRITDRMEILSKTIGKEKQNPETSESYTTSTTTDVEEWNDVFMASYSIPTYWKNELFRRESEALNDGRTKFVISRDSRSSRASGCLLTFVLPDSCLGVYCVGTIPELRGKGIARRMLHFAEKIALEHGCNRLTLQTLTSDHVAPMYKKIGYKTEFERDILWTPIVP
jgi:GNAT superfamily N-acetyltransferase